MPLINGKYYRPDEVKINILVDSESKIAADREIGKSYINKNFFQPVYSPQEYKNLEKLWEERVQALYPHSQGDWVVHKAESIQMFDTVSGDLVAVSEKEPENKKDDFYIVLWAGTVGVGMKENGETKEVTRTKEEAWADLILRDETEVNPMELVEVPQMPTVETDGGSMPITVSVVVVAVLSLIGTLARFLL